MIPKQISLKNFLSYREASLDFGGLHVACIAGPNGAGKSSLLEAMAWAIWGQSRVANDDDVIHQGAMEARVVFLFAQGEHLYRIIRSRSRLQGSSLEFQVQTEDGYRVLTQRGVRATQQLICHHLKLDYDTFINSAYLRQGRADDFMLKRPSERKEILADLLKLSQYDHLADRAKEHMRQAKAEGSLRQTQIDDIIHTIEHHQTTLSIQGELQTQLQGLDQQQNDLQKELQQLRQHQETVRQQLQQLQLKEQRYRHLLQMQQQTDEAITRLKAQLNDLHQVLQQAPAIEEGMQTLAALEAEDAALGQQFQQYQQLQVQRQELDQAMEGQTRPLQAKLQRLRMRHDTLQDQLAELAPILAKVNEIKAGQQQLTTAKNRLRHLDGLQLQAEPLLQRRRLLQAELQQEHTRLQTKVEDLATSLGQLRQQHNQGTQLAASVQEISQTLDYLERRRAYQEQVREKGQERRRFMESLQANLRTCETQLAQVDQKLQMLHHPEAVCPLCDRTLDVPHRTLVEDRHRLQQQELREQTIIIREQLAVTEREIQVLRQEYRAIETELELYAPVLQRRGQLEAELSSQENLQRHLRQLEKEHQQLQHCLETQSYGIDLRTELQQIDHTLAQLAYDDRDHALARGQVDRLRWADIKHHELKQTEHRQTRLKAQLQSVLDTIAEVEEQLQALDQDPLQQALQQTMTAITRLDYNSAHHQRVRDALRQAQAWPLRQRDLEQARQAFPQAQAQLESLLVQRQSRQQDLAQLWEAVDQLRRLQEGVADDPDREHQLESQMGELQSQREALLAQLGALHQQQTLLSDLQSQLQQKQQELTIARQQQRVYQELAQAFGRNGIQAMMIENVLPQLEAETNRLLGRLSGHQLHVQFVTQRASKGRQAKLIDTLDILIGDASGTRPYETYSGGEAFRVNFAIRLALAQLLAQRSGLALKLLIIDEGFGTQDQEGCERLIAAINAIADDFACILAVTHIPHFREAFQTRIDVAKGNQGSYITMSS
jgi:exonuclease SbcC